MLPMQSENSASLEAVISALVPTLVSSALHSVFVASGLMKEDRGVGNYSGLSPSPTKVSDSIRPSNVSGDRTREVSILIFLSTAS